MIEKMDIWRPAKQMLDQYSSDAFYQAGSKKRENDGGTRL